MSDLAQKISEKEAKVEKLQGEILILKAKLKNPKLLRKNDAKTMQKASKVQKAEKENDDENEQNDNKSDAKSFTLLG